MELRQPSTPPQPSPSLREREGVSPCNIAASLPRVAAQRGDQVAMRCPGARGRGGFARYQQSLTYAQLDARSDAIAAGLQRIGIVRGVRTVVMVRPTPEFFLLMFALFKLGAVPVLVDPGIDRRALKQCLDEAQSQAFIGIGLAHAARIALGWAKSARIRVTVGRRWFWGGATLKQVEALGAGAGPQLAATQPDETAAILFTSGSTGVPKGVVYRHRHFVAQIAMLRAAFGIEAGGVDLPTFPPFALFDPALGLTSIIPDMDPTRPARADPNKLHDAIARFGVTQLFGSPALIDVLARFGAKLPTIRRVTSAGAPVPPGVVAKMRALLTDDAQLWTPYGATECLPVAVIEGRELQETRHATENGAGTCVGRPVAPNVVRIIGISDDAVSAWSDELVLPQGEVGEITVAGPSATDEYFNRPEATRLAKIVETSPPPPFAGDEEGCWRMTDPQLDERPQAMPAGWAGWGGGENSGDAQKRIVHRMGDVGYFDAQGRLWFCGRKSHRVQTRDGTLFTEQVEPVFNTHPDVLRTALVGIEVERPFTPSHIYPPGCTDIAEAMTLYGVVRDNVPVLCVELRAGIAPSQHARVVAQLREIGARHPHTARIERFAFHPKFPVDIRHNAKIGREKLALWAANAPSLSPQAKGRVGEG